MKKCIHINLLLLLIAFGSFITSVQGQYYTNKKYSFRKVSNIEYAIDTSFAGKLVSMKLDLYTPINDSNCLRPVMVVIHGGAWLAGDKADLGIVTTCEEFVKRGYLVASVNYRMGFHPTNYYVPYALCPQNVCTYAFDTAEYIRAAYRAMQDVKSVVRFLKNRSYLDSTDSENIYLLGESAGAFNAIAAAFTDNNLEKPIEVGPLADVPAADTDAATCLPSNPSRKRPDLGSVRGVTNLNGQNDQVAGVASFFGGVINPHTIKNSSISDTPWLYMFHQSCDVVVSDNIAKAFGKLYVYCYNPLNLCQPLATSPFAWGSKSIANYIDSAPNTNTTYTFTHLTAGGAYNCSPNSNCHGIDNISLRMSEVAVFFSKRISQKNNPITNCNQLHYNYQQSLKLKVYPTVTNNFSYLYGTSTSQTATIYNSQGQKISTLNCTNGTTQIDLSLLNPGIYFLTIFDSQSAQTFKIIRSL